MSTHFRKRPTPVPVPLIQPAPPTLEDTFLRMIVDLAFLPVRESAQADPGAFHPGGLSVAVLRRLAIRWCRAMRTREAFDASELDGLKMALEDFTDSEFRAMVAGAAALRCS